METWLTSSQVAALLGVTRGTVIAMAYDHRIPGCRFYPTAEGRSTTIRIPLSAVEELIERSLDPDAMPDDPDDEP